jgi:hypothetical protein
VGRARAVCGRRLNSVGLPQMIEMRSLRTSAPRLRRCRPGGC